MQAESPLAQRIRELIALDQAGPAADSSRRLARCCNALAVYQDIGGALLLRPDLLVLAVGWDEEDLAEPAEGQWRMVALRSAEERFPELKPLLPSRPSVAPLCRYCDGRGQVPVPRFGRPFSPCASCKGAGWEAESFR